MWSKPEQHTVFATARPIRVANLIDIDDCPDVLLDAIFSEAYARWGGRRTLVAPATPEGIDERYTKWLLYYDADIIYSFVELSDGTVADLHEQYAPSHLVLHRELQRDAPENRHYRIELPITSLSSLSVVPAFLSRSWGLGGPPQNVSLLSKYWDSSSSQFLQENFGFLSPNITAAHPDLYSCLTLITEEARSDSRLGKDARTTYVTRAGSVLNESNRDSQIS